jgi:hypothetical protein
VLESLQAGGLERSIKKTGASGFKAAKRKSRLNDSDQITFGASGSNNKTCTDTEIESSYEECGEKKRQKNNVHLELLSFNSDSSTASSRHSVFCIRLAQFIQLVFYKCKFNNKMCP